MQKYQGYARLDGTAEPAPSCTVTVYYAGTVVTAPIFSDDLVPPTSRSNPFTADADGYFYFYAPDGRYDVNLSGGGIVTPYTWGDVALLGGAEDAGITQVGNSLAAETTLYTRTLPAGVVNPDKKRVRLTSRGSFAANANEKRLRMKFGATTIFDSTLVVSGGAWEVKGEVVRLSGTTQVAFAKARVQNSLGVNLALGPQRTAPAETLSGTVAVTTTGQATANSDIVHDESHLEIEN